MHKQEAANIDRRTARGKELAERLNKQTILDNMPKVYFVEDRDRVRIGRTDWPGDAFVVIPRAEFETFRKVYNMLSMPLLDKTDE